MNPWGRRDSGARYLGCYGSARVAAEVTRFAQVEGPEFVEAHPPASFAPTHVGDYNGSCGQVRANLSGCAAAITRKFEPSTSSGQAS
jgi:hypothetical protein